MYLVHTHDIGSKLKITGMSIKEDNEIIQPNLYRRVSPKCFSTLTSIKKKNSVEVTLPKDNTKEILELEDFVIEPSDKLQEAQEFAFSKGRSMLAGRLDFSMMFDFFELINLNNFFLHKGYNIVVDQEESFFEIIKSGDAELKEKLKLFLELQNQLSKHQHWYKKFKDFELDAKRAKDVKEVEKHLNTFLSLFS